MQRPLVVPSVMASDAAASPFDLLYSVVIWDIGGTYKMINTGFPNNTGHCKFGCIAPEFTVKR